MPQVDFDFNKYVAARKSATGGAPRSGAPYAYPPDQRVLRALGRVTPVVLATEATVRLWNNVARDEVLGAAVKVTDKQFPEIYSAAAYCAQRLEVALPTVYVAPDVGTLAAQTFGTTDDAYVVLNSVLLDHLTPQELRFVIGHECGRMDNGHVVYNTALYYLMYSANLFVRWIVKPAVVALQSWARRAEITCDRAGLICCGDPNVALSAMVKLSLGSSRLAEQIDIDEYVAQLDTGRALAGRLAELVRSEPYLPKRVAALRLFSQTHYFHKAAGLETPAEAAHSLNWCDAQVAQVVSILGRGRDRAETAAGRDQGAGDA